MEISNNNTNNALYYDLLLLGCSINPGGNVRIALKNNFYLKTLQEIVNIAKIW